jgi:hypothetical protein
MTLRRTLLRVEELGGRVLPSATVTVAPPRTTALVSTAVPTIAASAWTGQGRFTVTTNAATTAKTYTWDGSAIIGSAGNFAVTGAITTVGNRTGQATGRVVVSNPRGTLTLTITGPTQAARSGLPASVTYKVSGATGVFARFAGQGTLRLSTDLFLGYTDRGHFAMSATAPVATPTAQTPPPTTKPTAQTAAAPSWTGQGRYTLTTNRANNVKTYTLQGSANFGSAGYFGIGGTIQTVGNVASGQATGRITLSDPRGTLILSVTGPTQTRNAGLPTTFTYKVVSGTGYFAHYVGQGTLQLAAPLFPGYADKGHFDIAVRAATK